MAGGEKNGQQPQPSSILTPEQEAILDMYLAHLDQYFEELKESEKIQVEIETKHLKRILTK
ncbi:hypothetical protein BH24BAC1_BH24BAC1_06530 [soil metagenome]